MLQEMLLLQKYEQDLNVLQQMSELLVVLIINQIFVKIIKKLVSI